MTDVVKEKLAGLLVLESKSNYLTFEDMAESLTEEFDEKDQELFGDDISNAVEEWWNATDDEPEDEES